MRILALEPYYGGSHRHFLDGWAAHSCHDWTLLTLPPYKWKWRMRHSAVTFAAEIERRLTQGSRWDLLFCSDMVSLAELRGLLPASVGRLPSVLYFHENQLTYPVRVEKERDFQFGMTNIVSALAADAVWFNSRFHRDDFLGAIPPFLNRMPDHRPLDSVERIGKVAEVHPPGVRCVPPCRGERAGGPLRILWAARWEHDKNPECFFEALARLKHAGVPFRLSVLGESFEESPEVFDWAQSEFHRQIDLWGYQRQRGDYERALFWADVFASTAVHEFFGIGTVEAMIAGTYPLLPRRLSYPELLELSPRSPMEAHFYDGSAVQLARKLKDLAESLAIHGTVWGSTRERCSELGRRFCWRDHTAELDRALSAVSERSGRLDRVEAGDTL